MAWKIKQAMANGAITIKPPREKKQQTADPAHEWTPPASEPISAALLVAEQKLDDESMEKSWEQQCDQDKPEDDEDGLALEEANLERVSNLNDVMEEEISEAILEGAIP